MPNWCENTLTIRGPKKDLDELEQIIKSGKFFSTIIPEPPDSIFWVPLRKLSWRTANWGTKWDIDPEETTVNYSEEPDMVVRFDTAWTPPVGVYSEIEDKYPECGLTATYYEGGESFCGLYEEGSDMYFDIEGGADWVEENIPSVINENHRISELLREFEESENAEERRKISYYIDKGLSSAYMVLPEGSVISVSVRVENTSAEESDLKDDENVVEVPGSDAFNHVTEVLKQSMNIKE